MPPQMQRRHPARNVARGSCPYPYL
jgi:hypothetical protein